MLELLRASHTSQRITLTQDFKRDLRWFARFLAKYNGVNLYDHAAIHQVLELDACLTGLGGRVENYVYHLPIDKGYENCTIVHLEMVNILVAIRLFAGQWTGCKILVKCDNQAVVSVLSTGRTRDPYLSACARNIWYCAASHDIDMQYIHIPDKKNVVAGLLSRWTGTVNNHESLLAHIPNPWWVPVTQDALYLDPEL